MTPRYVYVNVNIGCKVRVGRTGAAGRSLHWLNRNCEWNFVMTTETMNIREMCDAFDVTPRTLRFYEAKELLFPMREGQKRLFTKRDRARLKLILRGKRFGFALEEIRQLLDLYHMDDEQETQLSKSYELAEKHLADMEAQKAELEEAIGELKKQMEWGAAKLDALAKQKTAAA